MSKPRMYAILWLSGLIVGVVLTERWRRTGSFLVPAAPLAGSGVETPTTPSDSGATQDKPKVSAVLFAGAKADVHRVRRLARRAMPQPTSVPSVAQLRWWSRAATTGDNQAQPE